MVRVSQPMHGKQATSSNGLRASKVSRQRNKHKVVLESVGQQARKVLSFCTDPPPGYTFIPAGNPELTAALKDFAKKGNHQIYAVSATPHASRHELSREVHRIGFHFPTEVVARVCSYYGIRLTSGGKLVEEKDDDKLFMRLKQRGLVPDDGEKSRSQPQKDQITINTEAKQIIKDLFPNIPDNDLFQIIKTAFQLGDGKVGTAEEIPLVRRAQLSVVAHIRHTYTSYDKLLRQVPYSEARHRVENETLKRLIDWRGDEDDKQAVEDTLREVVVISDEEDSDDDLEDGQVLDNSDVRVQLVKANKQEQPQGSRARSPVDVVSDDEPPRGYRYVPQVVRRVPLQGQRPAYVARQESRYAIWDRYRQEYRAAVAPQQQTRVVERILIEDPATLRIEPSHHTRESHYSQEQIGIMEPPPTSQTRLVRQPSPPTYVRAADGRLYERIVVQAAPGNAPQSPGRPYNPPNGTNSPYRSAPASPRVYQTSAHPRTPSIDDGDGSIMPSIEGSQGLYASSAPRRKAFDDTQLMHRNRHLASHDLLRRQPLIDLTDDSGYTLKRRRVEVTPPVAYPRRHDETSTRHHLSQYPDDRVQPHRTEYVNEDRMYANQQHPRYEQLTPIEGSLGLSRPQVFQREPNVLQSPRAFNHTESHRRVYRPDERTGPLSLSAEQPVEGRREVRVYREQIPPSGNYAPSYQPEIAQEYDNAASVRYVHADGREFVDSEARRSARAPVNGAHLQDPKLSFDRYRDRQPAPALARIYTTDSHRDEALVRTTYVQH